MGRMGARPAVDYKRLAAGDFSELSLGVDALGTDFRALHSELLSYGGYRPATVRRVGAAQLTPEWLQQNGGFRPVLVPASPDGARDMGLALPEGSLTVDRLASKIGLPFEVHTLDVQTQGEGPRWTLHQWCLYWEARRAASREPPPGLAAPSHANGSRGPSGQQPTPRRPAPAEDEADSAAVKRKRSAEEEAAAQQLKGISGESKKRLVEVAALPLAGTALEGEVSPPTAVLSVDLAQQVWPQRAPSRPTAGVTLVMSPEGCYTDFHLAAGGASVWLHCVSGRRSLALVPPTPSNLATYAAWAASARHAGVFLPAHCEGVIKVDVGPGDTLIIPAGWAHAAATTSSAVVLGGTFLRRDALATHLEAWRIEDHLAVRPRFRLPAFKQVMWYAAAAFSRRLRRLAGLTVADLRDQVAQQLAATAEQEAAAAAAACGSQGASDSDSVSKAGAAKKKKGWVAGQQQEVADDATTQAPGAAAARAAAGMGRAAAQRVQQPPASAQARAGGSPMAAAGPRQIGRAVGGGSHLLRASGGSGGGGAAAGKAPARRMNPTQLTVDMRGGGGSRGGGGGGGGGSKQRKRQRSPDSFIEQDSADDDGAVVSDGGMADSDAEGAEWAPQGGAAADAAASEDDRMSDDVSDDEAGLDELAATARRHRFGGEAEAGEAGAGGGRPRRMTARQAAREAAMAVAWDSRRAAVQHTGAGSGGASDEDEEDFDLDLDGEVEDWGAVGGGSGGRGGRQSTRHRGKVPPRLAAMLQQEEEEEEEGGDRAPLPAETAAGGDTATEAWAAFAAVQQPLPVPVEAGAAQVRPVKIRVKASAPVAAPPQQQQQQVDVGQWLPPQPAAAGKLRIKIKPAAVGAGGGGGQQVDQPAPLQQQQQQQQQQQGVLAPGSVTIPQVDGAGDEQGPDELQAMYAALYGDGGEQQAQQQAQQQKVAQVLPEALASPLGQSPRQPEAAAAAAAAAVPAGGASPQRQAAHAQQGPQAALERPASLAAPVEAEQEQQQEQQHQQQQHQQQQQQSQHQQEGEAQPAQVNGGQAPPDLPAAGEAAAVLAQGAAACQQGSPALMQHADSSQGQLAAGGGDSGGAAHPSQGGSQSPSVEGPAASQQQQQVEKQQGQQQGPGVADSVPAVARETAAAAAFGSPQAAEAAPAPAAGAQQATAAASAPLAAQGAATAQRAQQAAALVLPSAREHHPAGSSGAPSPAAMARISLKIAPHLPAPAAMPTANPPPAVPACVPAAADEDDSSDRDDEGAAPPEPLSMEEEDGLAALLAALKQWLKAPHALNDVPLPISSPKAVVARLEVCMRALGLSLTPPPPVDFDSVPLERLLPVRTPRGGTAGLPPSHQTPQTLGGSEFVPGELDAVGELEDGGEFDPADLEEEGGPGGVVVEESAGPKHTMAAPSAAKQAGAGRAGGAAGRGGGGSAGGSAPPAKRAQKMSVKDRLKKKLQLK